MIRYSRDQITWRYLPQRTIRHALLIDSSMVGHSSFALCGIGLMFDPIRWKGTGSQAEYDTVAGLPECQRCVGYLAVPHA